MSYPSHYGSYIGMSLPMCHILLEVPIFVLCSLELASFAFQISHLWYIHIDQKMTAGYTDICAQLSAHLS